MSRTTRLSPVMALIALSVAGTELGTTKLLAAQPATPQK